MNTSPFSQISSIYGKNHFEIDGPLQLIGRYFGRDFSGLSELGLYAGTDLYEIAEHVDKRGRPQHVMWSIDGERVDRVWLDPSERESLDALVSRYHVNLFPYRDGDWFSHFASEYLISDPGMACVLTVTNQTAYAIFKYGSSEQKSELPGLTGGSLPLKWGATWFTEIQGGSDLGSNTVSAANVNGKWHLNGNTKYFSSDAGLADLALVSARLEGSVPGAKGLSLFLVPEFSSDGKRNFSIRRLKDKSATAAVPTGEVEFQNSEASFIGDPDKGIYYIMEDLMVSRLSNSFGALGVARKSYLEAYFYTGKRSAFGRKLSDHPLVRRDLMEMEIYLEGTLALSFLAVDAFQKSYMETPPYTPKYHFARLLTHIAKNLTADMAAFVSQMAMELHGGIGFLREFPIERLHREALITPIWEGPSNIQALDMLESMQKKKSHIPLLKYLEEMKSEVAEGKDLFQEMTDKISLAIQQSESLPLDQVQFMAKDTLSTIGHSLAVAVLIHAGNKLDSERFLKIANLYAARFVYHRGFSPQSIEDAEEIIRMDQIEKVSAQ
jgi:alkylation response protein AidB-like acyl-CoA dehydrogenase